MVNCPKCDAAVDVEEEELDEGDELTCEDCGANIRVTGVGPLELEASEDEEEDEEEADFAEEDGEEDWK